TARVREQPPLGHDRPRQPLAARDPDRVRPRRRPQQRHLPEGAVPPPPPPPRRQQSDRRRRPLDPRQRLPHPQERRALPRPRLRSLPTPRTPRPHRPPAHPPTRTTRPPRHARTTRHVTRRSDCATRFWGRFLVR